MHIRIATRKSELALWQARDVASKLAALPDVSDVELVPLSTRGDDILDRSLQKIGGKGLFIKELETAMHEGLADIAVHSMKDVPAEMPRGFCIAAVLERANPLDALVTIGGGGLETVRRGGTIGSSSLRRQAQLKALRPDIDVVPLRGNVNTRLAKLHDDRFDAIVLACAGLERLGFGEKISQAFDPAEMLPAAAQGVVGIECLDDRSDLRELLTRLQHPRSRISTLAERAVARRLEASCQSPVASYATFVREDGNELLRLEALVASTDGRTLLREIVSGPTDDAEALGISAAERLLERGAGDLLEQ